jgi:hypothetical protein
VHRVFDARLTEWRPRPAQRIAVKRLARRPPGYLLPTVLTRARGVLPR